ncbi:Putative HNH nuclease YajD [Methylorubrum populi]
MATRPRTFRPGSGRGSDADRQARARDYDQRRRAESETRALYGTARWQRRRAAQLRLEPLCRRCRDEGRIVAATVADHVVPHRGDVAAFWEGELQSLCTPCHNQAKQAEERAAPIGSLAIGNKGAGTE